MQRKLLVSEQAILKTLCYSDIFDYPLTKDEIQRYLIAPISDRHSGFVQRTIDLWSLSRISIVASARDPGRATLSVRRQTGLLARMTIRSISNLLKKKVISSKNGYFCLKGREKIILLRKEREAISKKKVQRAKKIAFFISFIPTVALIGVSGSLALNNASQDDDIDFFIITQKYTLWITRMLLIVLLSFLGARRGRKIKDISNKICMNMFLDGCTLLLPKNKRNLFTAHEIAQMKTIFVRNEMYNNFIQSNIWVTKYLPNTVIAVPVQRKKKSPDFITLLLHWFIFPLEKSAKLIQLCFINKHKTTEYISDTLLAFHPHDKTAIVLKRYNKRLKYYGIPI